MCKGAAILWNKEHIKRRAVLDEQNVGTEAVHPTPRTTRKRKRNPENWQKNLRKKAVNSGESFSCDVKSKTGKISTVKIKQREMKPPCSQKCRLKCNDSFNHIERSKIFEDFYKLADKSKQSHQIAALVSQASKKRSTTENKENHVAKRNREFSRTYTLKKDGKPIQVCALMFLNTLGINEKRVRNILNNITATGAPLVDGRGRHRNHKTCKDREETVMNHIKLFKVVESHYVRKEAKYEYLPKELNVAEMYRMYCKWCAEKGKTLESYSFYYRVFNERFNLKFQQPKKDKCDTCETFNNLPNPSTEEKESQNRHINDKKYVREIKELCKTKAKENVETLAAAFDLQKVLLCPHGQTSSFFYSRRLANHNFTITELESMDTHCYFWNESECRKGAVEVATSLERFIKKRTAEGIKEIYLFCDRCGGQNNNRMLYVMLSNVLNECEIDSISLTYLVSGHSHSENDNAHSVIEQMSLKTTVYTPAEWEAVIKCSFRKNRCFLDVMTHLDVIDYKSELAFPEYKNVLQDKTTEEMTEDQKSRQKELNVSIGLAKRKVDKVFWSEIVELKFDRQTPDEILFKYSYTEEYRRAKFSSPKRILRKKETQDRQKPMKAYTEPCGISLQKKADLQKLCSRGLIPQQHHKYFNDLPISK